MMAHYKLILAYDGTEYSGFQRQAGQHGGHTIQSEIERSLRTIGWDGRTILAAGRTDAGVHALGQVIAFEFDWTHSDSDLMAALNANLPGDIAIQQVSQISPAFHPRYDACWRRYRYQLFCHPVRNPLLERYAWRIWPQVELHLINQAASHLIGEHDFGAFGSPPRLGGTTIRYVMDARWEPENDGLVFVITGNAFLYRMVRRIVSLLVEIGQGKIDLQMVDFFLQNASEKFVRGVAPAQGLTLVEVGYASQLK